ncbi:MAG: hypothetical protein GY821_17710 [Gammaproteobacteria bacterium]|nr:hypothetical protein [Gammaproteobacteria bacterium]
MKYPSDIDAIIALNLMHGKSITRIALDLGRTERTMQLRWKKTVNRLHCRTSREAAAKLAVLCERENKRYPVLIEDVLKILL